jgi:hypothetical protein
MNRIITRVSESLNHFTYASAAIGIIGWVFLSLSAWLNALRGIQ